MQKQALKINMIIIVKTQIYLIQSTYCLFQKVTM